MLNKLYVYGAILAIIGLGWARYNYVVNDRDELKLQNTHLVSANQNLSAINAKKEKDIGAATDREQKQILANEAIKNEVNDYRACVDAGKCGVRWKLQACPVSSGAIAVQPNTNEAPGANRGDFESWYFDLLTAIRENHQQIIGLQEDVRVRSHPDYCKIK